LRRMRASLSSEYALVKNLGVMLWVTHLVAWRHRYEENMNKTMNPQKRANSRTWTNCLPGIERMLQGQDLLLYRDPEHRACGIYNLLGSIRQVVPFSASMLLPSQTLFNIVIVYRAVYRNITYI
jgi:hypothetical protein